MNKKKVFIGAAIVIVLGVGGFTVFRTLGAQNSSGNALPIAVDVIGKETITSKVTAKGEVSLLNTELIYANITAEVDEVLVEKNDIVTAGQPIIRYREKTLEDLQRSVENARLNVRDAELSINSLRIPPSEASVEKAKNAIDSAALSIQTATDDLADLDIDIARQQDKIATANKNLEDNKILFQAGALSQSVIDDAEDSIKDLEDALDTSLRSRDALVRSIDSAEESHRISELDYQELVNQNSSADTRNSVERQQITLEKARLDLANLEKELADFQQEILSPIDGTVTVVSVSQGEVTPTDKVLMEIADVTDYIIKVDINERNASKIQIGQKVELEGAVLGEEVVTGVVSKIGYIAETKQNNNGTERVVPIEITVDKSPQADTLKPGFSLDAAIITEVKEDVVTVPILATLSEADGSNYVFVVKEDNTLEKRAITLGAYADMTVEATGLSEGEKVVSQPTVDMTDGMAVTLPEPEPAEAEAETGAEAAGGEAQ